MTEEKRIETAHKNCANCGGNLVFYPPEQSLRCENCLSIYPIDKNEKIKVHSLKNSNDDQSEDYKEYVEQNKVFKCSNCGSNVVLNVYDITKNCPYCGTSLVINQEALPGLKPDGVLPFLFDEEKAAEYFEQNIKKKHFLPNKFKKSPPKSLIKGLYIPSFSFNGHTESNYTGRLYNEYTTTDSEGNIETHRSYFNVSGHYTKSFTNVLTESSSKINQANLSGILPFDFSKKVEYKDEFIKGFSTEHYSEKLEDCAEKYRSIAKSQIRSGILRKYTYDGVDYINVDTDFSEESYSYMLVPMYRFNYKYKEKDYITYMNGQSGKIESRLPKSIVKITFLAIFIALLVLIPIALILIFGMKE